MKLKHLRLSFFVFFTLLWALPILSFAQQEVHDPLKKPDIWAKLEAEPSNRSLWAKYFGKPLEELNYEENENLSLWSQVLTLKSIMAEEIVIESVSEGSDEDNEEPIEMDQADLDNLTEIIMAEKEEVADLKSNLQENFVILEDLYSEIFEEYGQNYVFYDKVHPKGEYPITKWVEEVEKKIKEMKDEKLKQITSRVKVRN